MAGRIRKEWVGGLDETDKARERLIEAMGNDRTFDKYIRETLAGDFAVALMAKLKGAEDGGGSYRIAKMLPTEDLKLLWDSYDGIKTLMAGVDGESVHRVLNERGHGIYCAV